MSYRSDFQFFFFWGVLYEEQITTMKDGMVVADKKVVVKTPPRMKGRTNRPIKWKKRKGRL